MAVDGFVNFLIDLPKLFVIASDSMPCLCFQEFSTDSSEAPSRLCMNKFLGNPGIQMQSKLAIGTRD